MIKHVDNRRVSELLNAEHPPFYDVPKYQREYVWGRHDWEELLDDLLEQEGADGHFLGTFICVNREEDSTSVPRLEVIDGQQRLTTISLALAAIYSVLGEHMDPTDEEAFTDVVGLRRMLVLDRKSRVTPQVAASNRDDYLAVLKLAGLEISAPAPTYMGVRRIEKAYQFFRGRIESLAAERTITPIAMARDLLARFKRAQLVKLEVNSYSDAFTLFESLNNRGKPLTPIDLIKNSLLSKAERAPGIGMDEAYVAWQQWLDSLGDEYSTQERFFRHFYNAMKDTWDLSVPRVPIATRSNLIQVYEDLVNRDVEALIERLTRGADAYARLVNPLSGTDLPVGLNKALADLNRAEGTTAHVLLLHLLLTRDELGLGDTDIAGIARLLVAFSVRRNLTNVPATYALQPMFMEIISELRSGDGSPREVILRRLKLVSSTDEQFLSALGGRIYEDNTAVVRFILVSLSEQGMTKENWQDLWARDATSGGTATYRWTIEHVLPQSENLGTEWVSMLGGPEEAARTRRDLVHHLGNLTVSGFNSSLGKKSFLEKRDRVDSEGRPIGYRNGLSLNRELAGLDTWNRAAIEKRTGELAALARARFPLE